MPESSNAQSAPPGPDTLDGPGLGRSADRIDATAGNQAKRTLTQDAESYRRSFENSREAIFLTDPVGDIIAANPAACSMLGRTEEEICRIGRAGVLDTTDRRLPTALAERERTGFFRGELGCVRGDGSRFPAEIVSVSFRDASGARRTSTNIRDLTEKKAAESAIREAQEALERRVAERTSALEAANRELETFSYSISHELRSPLRAIDGFTALLSQACEGLLDEEGQRLFERVRWNAQRMGALIDDLLAFTSAGRADLAFGIVDMTSSAKAAFSRVPAESGFRSRIHLTIDDLPEVHGDASLLGRVWENLLSNAMKFSSIRERPEIRVEGSLERAEAVYRVRDNGVGFDMQYADELFGVFHRLHGTTEFEGTGVGLALVRRIVTRHGGRVWAEGDPGRGATFSFSLPARKG